MPVQLSGIPYKEIDGILFPHTIFKTDLLFRFSFNLQNRQPFLSVFVIFIYYLQIIIITLSFFRQYIVILFVFYCLPSVRDQMDLYQ